MVFSVKKREAYCVHRWRQAAFSQHSRTDTVGDPVRPFASVQHRSAKSDKTVLGLDWQLPLLWPLQPRGQHCKDPVRCLLFKLGSCQ